MRLLAAITGLLIVLGLLVPVPLARAQDADEGRTTIENATSSPETPIVAPAIWLPTDARIGDETWTADTSPYVIQGTAAVNGNLSIEPGVTVKFAHDAALNVYGTLTVSGTANQPVVFTSVADDSVGGDTNGDGTATAPENNRWHSIATRSGSASASITYADFRYGGNDDQSYGSSVADSSAVIDAVAGTFSVAHSAFGPTLGADVNVYSAAFTAEHVVFGPSMAMLHVRLEYEAPDPSVTVHDSSFDQNVSSSPVWVPIGSPTLHLENNWWGSVSGPGDGWLSTQGNLFNPVNPVTYTDPWLADDSLVTGESAAAPPASGDSNVLFLPGMEGSRLYDADDKLWEPFDLSADGILGILFGAGDARVRNLFLTASGESKRSDIHTKEGDVLDTTSGADYYASFITHINSLKSNGTINDWKPIAYDWRFSPQQLVENGAERDGGIYYEEASDTPYIEQELHALASTSKTGKVTIVAHSDGGLVAKALMQKIGKEDTEKLIDAIVFVGVPQSGTPSAVGSLLFGYDEGISALGGLLTIVSAATARTLAGSAPAAYHLLPSQAYFESAQDPRHPLLSFDGDLFSAERAAYGTTVSSWSTLASFLANAAGTRAAPDPGDLSGSAVLSPALLSGAHSEHATLDAWVPPAGVTVYQIAGWGEDTVAGISFYDETRLGGLLSDMKSYRPEFTEDGDGTVTVPSALLMGEGTSTPHYWLNLASYASGHANAKHGQELSIQPVQDFITSVIEGAPTLPDYFSTDAPQSLDTSKRLRFMLHNGSSISLYDGGGHRTLSGTSAEASIPGSSYGQLGNTRYVSVPADGEYSLSLTGASSSPMDLDIEEDGASTTISTIADIPSTASTTASMTITNGGASPLTIDEDGDGSVDMSVTPLPGEDVDAQEASTTEASTTADTQQDTPPVTQQSGSAASGAGGSSGQGAPRPSSSAGAGAATTTKKKSATTTKKATTTPNKTAKAATAKKKTSKSSATSTKKAATSTKAKKTSVKSATTSASQAAAALAALPASVRAAISTVLAAVSTFLTALSGLLTSLLHIL